MAGAPAGENGHGSAGTFGAAWVRSTRRLRRCMAPPLRLACRYRRRWRQRMTRLGGLALGMLLLGSVAHAQDRTAAPTSQVKLDKHKLSYAIGYQIGSQFAGGEPDVDLATVQKAMADAYAKRTPSVSMQDMHAQLQRLEQQLHANAVAEFKHIAQTNARKSALFMAQNR